ncbi:major facilitator superfamily transporter [Purpureocillium lavendulum]|uniref:Major facilitator superfamily transporter n=1 Tax=Purpureocillium lavendulum TaxID=1247861 RepID=A0AB34FTS3_9HYPO|nr:major facilitator superfamily transporter [Purpureocillium lavendulum]
MSHHRDVKPLWLIQPCLDAGEYRDKLIGSVVKYPELPTERRIPYHSGTLPRDLVAGLDPKPLTVHNVNFWKRNIKDGAVRASVSDLIDLFVDRARADTTSRTATVARMWHMDSPGEKFKALLRDRAYFDELFDLLRDNHDRGYFVTDVVTLANLEVVETTGVHAGAGAQASLPVPLDGGLAGGLLTIPAVGGGARAQVTREGGFSGAFEGETVVFLGYRQVLLEKVDGARARLRRAVLGGQTRRKGWAVRDNLDYWPTVVDGPAPGNANWMGTPQTPAVEVSEQGALLALQQQQQHGGVGVVVTEGEQQAIKDGGDGDGDGHDDADADGVERRDDDGDDDEAQAAKDRETVALLEFDVAVVG